MKSWVLVALFCGGFFAVENTLATEPKSSERREVFVIPVREDIMPPLTYIIRRGVKEAMQADADLIVLDMDTHGGRLDVTEQIIQILDKFPGKIVTYVDRKAFSAGAYIAVATPQIYMAEEAVIGAATPILLAPGGGMVEMPESVEAKMTSGVKALIRAKAEKNGYNVDVIEAMIDRHKELILDGDVINPKGQILTLTSREAAREYGNPPRPLLSSGTYSTLGDLLDHLGYGDARRHEIRPTGVEKIAFWLNTISPILLAIGLIGLYIEFKTPGFGIAGIVGIAALLLYFVGGYIAGLSGIEWVAVFALGIILIAVELFVFPGTLALGLTGAALVLISLLMAATDLYPGTSLVPTLPQLRLPVRNFAIAALIAIAAGWALGAVLPRTPAYRMLVSIGTSGSLTDSVRVQRQVAELRREGVAISTLRPGGKAQFGEDALDVMTQGEMIARGARVRIIGHSGTQAIVEEIAA